jgi:glucose-6-phosphate 1-epimerase
MDISQLNEKFGIPGSLEFIIGEGGFINIIVKNSYANMVASLYGAHIMSYQPIGQKDTLWMSPQSSFETGKPIRGGIPVCFPWFGPHPEDNNKPAHGFARLNNWELIKTGTTATGETEFILELKNSSATQLLWPHSFIAQLKVIVGKRLDVTLTYTNNGSDKFAVSDALHSYFNVSSVDNIGISGLSNHKYYEGFAKTPDHVQAEAVLKIKQEENRRYINQIDDCMITDNGWNRKIKVSKRGSKITVVWNPWEATTKTIADLPDNGYKSFICVEAVNAYDDMAVLKPGDSYSISAIIEVM